MSGESVSARGILEAIGGVRGVLESLIPATVYLGVFVLTQDARVAVIAPLAISFVAIAARLMRREPLSAALSGFLGVLICVIATLITGRGEDFFLPGFWINGAWIIAHSVSLLVGWPLIGLLLGFLRGSLTEWRRIPMLRRAASLCTVVWIVVFAARLGVQLPLYFAANSGDPGAVEALGIARLVMGIPLFAIAVLFTWLVLSRVSSVYAGLSEAAAAAAVTRSGSESASTRSSDE
ncbi:DUF3159 domain-containing protein [Leucobacter sp. W1478]|uniref:DUF3159 domain-containing protein n=1 Tax=Leucobacter sp. W1478 TaxID=3439065 RepID=UPI003F3FD822